jgi:acid phosphatase
MNIFYKKCIIIVTILFVAVSCDRKPKNLTTAKEEVEQYYENGHFESDVKLVVDQAIEYFYSRVCCGPDSAVVFDIDDTLLWSYHDMKKIQFGFVPKLFHDWIMKAETPSVPHVKRLYNFFVEHGCKIILLTGRRFDERDATVRNLNRAGYTKIDLLITRSEAELSLTALEYKSKQRQRLQQQGYTIIATIGDQYSDLDGGYAYYKVKIPNYTYLIY